MKEEQYHSDPLSLINKYLNEEANATEVEQLEAWVLASPENRAQFQELQQAWKLAGIADNPLGLDANQEWEKLNQLLPTHPKVVKLKPRRNPWLRLASIAAAVMIIGLVGFWFFQNTTANNHQYAATDAIENRSLPDGSQISLNQFASLSYQEKANRRQVKLEGDAFFDVQRDTKRPFIIETDAVDVEVLGTSFYVDARATANETQVVVASGKVAVRAADQEVILTKGEIAIYDKIQRSLLKKTNEDPYSLTWQQDSLVFNRASLEQVVLALNRKFHSQIKLQTPVLANCPFTGKFIDPSLEEILKVLEVLFELEIKREDEIIWLSGGKC